MKCLLGGACLFSMCVFVKIICCRYLIVLVCITLKGLVYFALINFEMGFYVEGAFSLLVVRILLGAIILRG